LLDLLLQLVPTLQNVAVVLEPANPSGVQDLRDIQASAQPRGIEVVAVGLTSAVQVELTLEAALDGHPQALILSPTGGVITTYQIATIMSVATRHNLPTAAALNGGASALSAAGGLLHYGPNSTTLYRRAGNHHLDRILRGAKPADLPVEGPTVFDVAVNRTTARTLGIDIPAEFAAQVTEWVD
jgi:putative ABC transport system substrate-binding protein